MVDYPPPPSRLSTIGQHLSAMPDPVWWELLFLVMSLMTTVPILWLLNLQSWVTKLEDESTCRVNIAKEEKLSVVRVKGRQSLGSSSIENSSGACQRAEVVVFGMGAKQKKTDQASIPVLDENLAVEAKKCRLVPVIDKYTRFTHRSGAEG